MNERPVPDALQVERGPIVFTIAEVHIGVLVDDGDDKALLAMEVSCQAIARPLVAGKVRQRLGPRGGNCLCHNTPPTCHMCQLLTVRAQCFMHTWAAAAGDSCSVASRLVWSQIRALENWRDAASVISGKVEGASCS